MAAVESSASLEDDEDWLYGDEKKPNVDQLNEKIAKKKKTDVKKEAESGDDSEPQNTSVDNAGDKGDAEDDEDDDDDDDDDDNVQVTIGDIRTWTGTETAPRNLFKSGQNYQKGSTISPAKPIPATKGLDIDAVGTINGTPVYDFDLNSLSTDEMPWRKPGADINDYFNYGFTEETWRIYSERQKILRSEGSGGGGGSNVGGGGSGPVMFPTPIAKLFKAALPRPMLPKPGLLPPPVSLSNAISILNSIANSANNIANNNMPPSNNAPSNNNNNIITIGVIGGNSSRRKDDSLEQPIPVAGSFNRAIPVTYNQPPPSMPNTNLPPPVMQVHPQFGTGMPHFDSFYPPTMPQQAPQFIGGTFPPAFPPPFADPNPPPVNTQPHWEPRGRYPSCGFHGRDRWEIGRPEHARSPPRRDDDYDSRMFRERDRDREREWDRDKERDWDRGREKSRDRDRSKEQERSRDVDRSRERDRERSRERERDRSRERDRDRSRDRNKSKDRDRDHDRDRDRNRDRDRERSKSKERDSSRNKDQERGRETTRARDRDDKHKASRRKHRDREHEESDTESRSSSKHKKSKRRKESKDEETPAPAATEEKPRE